jgi:hypothetical protein
LVNEAFRDAADAWLASYEYESEYDVCSEEWYEFRRLVEAVVDFGDHYCSL